MADAFTGYRMAPTLHPGETVVNTWDASPWDVGIFAWMLGRKIRMVHTNHRLLLMTQGIVNSEYAEVPLRAIRYIAVTRRWLLGRLLGGILMLTIVLFLIAAMTNDVLFTIDPGTETALTSITVAILTLGAAILMATSYANHLTAQGGPEAWLRLPVTAANVPAALDYIDSVSHDLTRYEPAA